MSKRKTFFDKILSDKGISLSEVQKKTNIAYSALIDVKKGHRDPKFETLRVIAKAIKVKFRDLVDDDGNFFVKEKESKFIYQRKDKSKSNDT